MANPIYGQNKFDDELDSRMLRTADGVGIHEYYEEVQPTTADDNDVAASLSIKLPIGCIVLDATIISRALATSDHGLWALEMHTAAIADDAASAGTEIVGEDVASDVSIPDNDLDTSSDAGSFLIVNMGSLGAASGAAAVTYFHVCAKEDCSSMTGTPVVGVYVKWFGPPAVAI
tara:strand:- start:263 stop:784 length:522 start_codon:yes stop_codon:yes gene_type:complete